MTYNTTHKITFAEPVLTVRFVQHAKRYKKITYLRRRLQPNSLRWNPINSCILQKSKVKVAFTSLCKILSTLKPLPPYRSNPDYHLCNNRRHLSLKQDQNLTRQQFFSTNNWPQQFSLCQQFKTLSETSRLQNNPWYQQSTRSSEVKDLPAQAPHKPPLRSGLLGSYHLWKIHRRSQKRLQSAQERQTLLSSFALFRITHQRLLAWSLKAWRCLYRSWLGRILERMSRQIATLPLPYTPQGRFRFLRPQIHRTPRRRRGWLCDCSQNHSSHQETVGKPALSQFQKRLGSSRISLPTLEMEEPSSIRSDTQTSTRKRLRAAYALYSDPLRLSGLCKQSSYEVSDHLALLLRSGWDRVNYQRTQ